MKRSKIITAALITMMFGSAVTISAQDFKLGIMQDKKGAASKYAPMVKYLKTKGINVSIVAAKDYPTAAKMFSAGNLDGMFAGSGVAGSMIIKDVATPIVRPQSKDGWNTYWAVVLAKKGSATFTNKDYFSGKKVLFCSLASSGELYFRSLFESSTINAEMKKASSHGAAIGALAQGAADIAIVKNRVWDSKKSQYPDLVEVGRDMGENPNGTLIASTKADTATVAKLKELLLAIESDASADATAAKEKLGITGYIVTTKDDFATTIPMLKKAGVTKEFNFQF
jgi:ABC-type phosphate/phosphonate transport system substrate-binding protein